MKTTINGIEFTDQPPTKPGAYWWMHQPNMRRVLVEVDGSGTVLAGKWFGWKVTEMFGFWSPRLVPATEVEAAFREGCKAFSVERFEEDQAWDLSRARAVTEGTL